MNASNELPSLCGPGIDPRSGRKAEPFQADDPMWQEWYWIYGARKVQARTVLKRLESAKRFRGHPWFFLIRLVLTVRAGRPLMLGAGQTPVYLVTTDNGRRFMLLTARDRTFVKPEGRISMKPAGRWAFRLDEGVKR